MKKPTPGQLSLGFFAVGFLSVLVFTLDFSLYSVSTTLLWTGLCLGIFFLSLALAAQVHARGRTPLAIIIGASAFLAFALPGIATLIGSFVPPSPQEVSSSQSLDESFNDLESGVIFFRIVAVIYIIFFFSVVAGLLVPSRSISGKLSIFTKTTFAVTVVAFLVSLFTAIGLISIWDGVTLVPFTVSLTLFLAAITGIFRLEARKDPTVKSSISFDKDDSVKKSSQAVIPPPIAQQKSAGPKPVGLPNQTGPTSLPSQSEPVSPQSEPDSSQPEQASGSTPTQPEPASGSTQAQPDLAEVNQDDLAEEKSPFAENLTELTNPVFKEIKTESIQPESGPPDQASNQQIKPGWYQDPSDQGFIRYWDGDAWTGHRQPKQ